MIFIEPEYSDSPTHFGWTPNDNHPPTAIGPGENFLRDIYSSLTKDALEWNRTLLIATHDEHGGFFDHVSPLDIPSPQFRMARYIRPVREHGPTGSGSCCITLDSAGHGFQWADGPYVDIATAGGKIFWHDRIIMKRWAPEKIRHTKRVGMCWHQPLAQPRTDIPSPPAEYNCPLR